MMKKILLIFSVIIISKFYTQEADFNVSKVFPSSPDTYNLGNFGSINIGENSGTMQHNISLFEYSIGEIRLPISLQYSSNGIKVDDYNPSVGLGWILNAGGVISKITRDYDDLDYDFKSQKINLTPRELKLNFFEATILKDKYDTEKDIFRVNIPGIFSSTFIKKGNSYDNNEWLQEKKSDFKIEKRRDQNQNISFVITSPFGVKYYFELLESSVSRTEGLPEVSLNSGFFLTKIEDGNKNTVILDYVPETLVYTVNKNETYNFFENSYYIDCTSLAGSLPLASILGLKTASNLVKYNTYLIKKISNNVNNSTIEFNYSTKTNDVENRHKYLEEIILSSNNIVDKYNLDYLVTPNNRVFLNKVFSNITKKNYEFDYYSPQNLPKRLSYAQDYWGYYNDALQNTNSIGKINNPLIDYINFSFANRDVNTNVSYYGMLSKIKYPTNGYTEIYYEPHSEWGTVTSSSKMNSKEIAVQTDEEISIQQKSVTIISGKNQKIRIDGGASYVNNCISPKPPGSIFSVGIFVKNMSSGQIIQLQELSNMGYTVSSQQSFTLGALRPLYFDAVANTSYEITIKIQGFCQSGLARFSYYENPDVIQEGDIIVGGNRVEKVIQYDNNSSKPLTEKWYYGNKDNLFKSSGSSVYKPINWKYSNGVIYCPPTDQNPLMFKYIPYKYISIYSNSIIPLLGNESQNISYSYITKSLGGSNFEKGGKTTEYIMGVDPIGANIFGKGDYRGGYYTNSIWNKGLIKKTEDFIKSNSLFETVKTIENEYSNFDKEEIDNYIGVKYGSYQIIITNNYKCTTTDIITDSYGYNPCYEKTLETGIPYLEYDMLELFGEVLHYKFISHNYQLKKILSTEYSNGIPLLTTTNYYYDNSSHYQMTREETTFPDGTLNTKNFKYSHEKGNQYLIDKNMIGIPLQTTVTKNNIGISSVETKYPISQTEANTKTSGLPLPTSVISYGLQIPGSSSSSKIELTYDQYDNKGNILQYTEKGLKPTIIIWGYNKTQPIAKIEGAKYEDIKTLQVVIDAITASDTDATQGTTSSEQILLTALDNLRTNSSLSNYNITTYTYDPLIGVTSITSPNGMREIYKYDTANRLQSVVDMNGKILKEYQYNYKQ